jgi:hypothetical protein
MQRLFPVGLIAVLALLLVACEPQQSLFPLATDDDKVFDKQLLGEWKIWSGTDLKADQKPGLITFSTVPDDAYTYDVKIPGFGDNGKATLISRARLVKLGDSVFIEFDTPDLDKSAQLPYPLLESYVFGRLSLNKDQARFDFLNDEWVQNNIKAGKLPLAFVPTQNPVLSASTADLRKFALEHAEDQEAFSEVYSLARENQAAKR